MNRKDTVLAGHVWILMVLLLFSGCGGRRDRGTVIRSQGTPKCRQMIARMEAGNYTTYRSPRFWTEDVVRVQKRSTNLQR